MQKQAYELTDKQLEKQARNILAQYKDAREQIYNRLQKAYAEHLVAIDPDDYWTTLNAYNRLKKVNKDFKGIYTRLTNETYKEIRDGQKILFEEMYYRQRYVTEAFAGIVGEEVSRQALNPLITELAVTGDLDVWKKIRDERLEEIAKGIVPKTGKTLKAILADNASDDLAKLQQTIKQGLINGESYNKQIKKVKGLFDNSAYKTQRVIRTEGNRNMNAGAHTERMTSGVAKKKRWVATLDGETRTGHRQLDGQTVDIGQPFKLNGLTAQYPGGFGVASQDINCRCSVIDIIEGLEPSVRRGKNPLTGKSEIITYKNYNEWREK
ncbi:MAG: phage head morphogenesis protein [Clostridiales bacterium]|nr:phage head morphogenesis protein [Clostridiales bacterium]